MNDECKCELDGFQGAVWKGDCSLHKDDDKFIPHTNNNWEEEFDKKFVPNYTIANHVDSYQYRLPTSLEEIKQFISNLLTKKDQEHKVELEIIKGEIESKSDNFWGKDSKKIIRTEDAISILDSHINKLSTE